MKAAGLRVPESATPEQRELADECLNTMTLVMRGHADFKQAPYRLKAATALREEICGPLKQRVEHSFDGLTDEQLEARYKALVDQAQAASVVANTPPAAEEPGENQEP